MGLLDEPKDREGVAQVLSTKSGENSSTVWLDTPPVHSPARYKASVLQTIGLPPSLFAMLSDAVLWLSVAALGTKIIFGIQKLIVLGIFVESTAVTALLVLTLPLVFLALFVYARIQEVRTLLVYRGVLFILGVILGTI